MPVLELGSTVEGRVEKGGLTSYRIRGTRGAGYVLAARSTDFDVAVMVHNLELYDRLRGVRDDNSGGGTDALLGFRYPDDAEWVVSVEAKGDGDGAFQLSFVAREAPATAEAAAATR